MIDAFAIFPFFMVCTRAPLPSSTSNSCRCIGMTVLQSCVGHCKRMAVMQLRVCVGVTAPQPQAQLCLPALVRRAHVNINVNQLPPQTWGRHAVVRGGW
jgi:hypothetical protein